MTKGHFKISLFDIDLTFNSFANGTIKKFEVRDILGYRGYYHIRDLELKYEEKIYNII